jgi:AraC-like DNA-binding protein
MKHVLNIPPERDGGLWRYRTQPVRLPHHHRELEFNLVIGGTGTYLLEDRIYELGRHALIWLFPDQEHLLLQHSANFQMWIGVFKPEMLQRLCSSDSTRSLLKANPSGHLCRWLTPTQAARLETVCAEVVANRSEIPLFNAGVAYAVLSAWQMYQSATDIPSDHDAHPSVEKASRLIRDDPSSVNLAVVAKKAGLSSGRLSRLFKQQTGVSLVEFRNRQRLQRFFSLYGTGQRMTMLTAALEAGFGSYAQFHRVFKELTGRSPASHRKGIQPPKVPDGTVK